MVGMLPAVKSEAWARELVGVLNGADLGICRHITGC